MQRLKNFRLMSGLTQAELAEYLGVALSVVSMAESGRRLISGEAGVKFAAFMIHFHQNQDKRPASFTEPGVDKAYNLALREAKFRLKELKTFLSPERRRLTEMQKNYSLAVDKYTALQQLQSKLEVKDKGGKDLVWVKNQLIKSRRQLQECSPARQLEIRIKTEVMEAEIAIRERIFSAPENNI
jgi:transcriptional regulator with XRE-family HTH domain